MVQTPTGLLASAGRDKVLVWGQDATGGYAGSPIAAMGAHGDVRGADVTNASTVVALAHDGATVLTGTAVTAVEGAGVVLGDGRRIPADRLLVAVGRRPDTRALGLAAAGIATDARGYVTVDAQLRTTNPRVWAAGDVTGHPQLTHVAGVHGSTAAANAVLGLRRAAQVAAIPRVTFTAPEVASVGVPAGSRGTTARTRWHDEVDRAVAEGRTGGFTRLVLDRRGRLVGATVVGPRAGETLAELTMAVRRGLRARDLAAVMHPYPTWGDGPWNAAVAQVRDQLAGPVARRATRLLAARRRRRLDRGAAPG